MGSDPFTESTGRRVIPPVRGQRRLAAPARAAPRHMYTSNASTKQAHVQAIDPIARAGACRGASGGLQAFHKSLITRTAGTQRQHATLRHTRARTHRERERERKQLLTQGVIRYMYKSALMRLGLGVLGLVVVRAACHDRRVVERVGDVVAIGDVHGCLVCLQRTLAANGVTDPHTGAWIAGNRTVVQMGDLLDRGPDDASVIENIRNLAERANASGGRWCSLGITSS